MRPCPSPPTRRPLESKARRGRAAVAAAGATADPSPLARMKWSSRFLLALAALIHLGMLIGWRWQQPLVPYFFDATVLSGGRGLDFYSVYQAGYNARHGAD